MDFSFINILLLKFVNWFLVFLIFWDVISANFKLIEQLCDLIAINCCFKRIFWLLNLLINYLCFEEIVECIFILSIFDHLIGNHGFKISRCFEYTLWINLQLLDNFIKLFCCFYCFLKLLSCMEFLSRVSSFLCHVDVLEVNRMSPISLSCEK